MKTEASKADKTLIENLVKELIKQNISINKNTIQTLPDSLQIMNATKTPDTEDKEPLPYPIHHYY